MPYDSCVSTIELWLKTLITSFTNQINSFRNMGIVKLLMLVMMPKCSPVRCTTLTLEQPVPENRKVQKTPSKGGPVWSRPNTLRRLSQKAFFTTLECWRGISYTYLFWGCWGLFIVVRSCLIFLQSKPHRLAEQASQTCWASPSGLLDKPPMLVEQVSWNVMGKSGPSP